MDDKIFDEFNTLMNDFMQRFSFRVGDMLNEVPMSMRPLALAITQAIVISSLENMPESGRDLYDSFLNHIVLVAVPPELDPRKNKKG